MSVAILSGLTLTEFIKDGEAFNKCVNDHFTNLDIDGDGVLSRSELGVGFNCLLSLGFESGTEEDISSLYDTIFDKFDSDHSGTVDREEFGSEMKEIMLAVAHGIGDLPVQVALENDSFLMRAVELESAKRS